MMRRLRSAVVVLALLTATAVLSAGQGGGAAPGSNQQFRSDPEGFTRARFVPPEWPDRRTHPRGWVLSRVATHDAWHASEVNETLTALGLPAIDPWR